MATNTGHTHDAVPNLVVDVAPRGDARAPTTSRRKIPDVHKQPEIFSDSNLEGLQRDAELPGGAETPSRAFRSREST